MEVGVGGGKTEHVVARGLGLHVLHNGAQAAQVGLNIEAAGDGPVCSRGFQRHPNLNQPVDALGRHRGQTDALVGLVHHHALALEHSQCFAHRHPADPKLQGQLGFDDPVPGQDQALSGTRHKGIDDLVRQRARLQLDKGRRRNLWR